MHRLLYYTLFTGKNGSNPFPNSSYQKEMIAMKVAVWMEARAFYKAGFLAQVFKTLPSHTESG
jgi:hypothetical protein